MLPFFTFLKKEALGLATGSWELAKSGGSVTGGMEAKGKALVRLGNPYSSFSENTCPKEKGNRKKAEKCL